MRRFLRPQIPDAENFVAVPFIQEAFQADREGRELNDHYFFLGMKPGLPDYARPGRKTLAQVSEQWRRGRSDAELADSPSHDLLRSLAEKMPALQQLREADGGYTLWSIGANRVDDQGKARSDGPDSKPLDQIWKMPGK